jgi:cation diffusion facilitator family transporter
MSTTTRTAAVSILVGLSVLAFKTAAWWMTGSLALMSDALESIVNVATACAALVAVRIAAQPADANHPYGHHKAEFFSAVLSGALIIVAAVFIFYEAVAGLLYPKPLNAPLSGIAVNAVASLINGIWCWVLLTKGRTLKSPALVADGKHLLSDIISSVGVTLGVVLAIVTGWHILDPLLAALVALNILWSGSKVVSASISGLMDEAVSAEQLHDIRQVIGSEATGALEAHDLRTRHAGRATFIDFHLVVPGNTSVSDAHDICDRIERKLKSAIPGSIVTIHVEPENKAKQSGVLVL